ncbi:MAG: carboxypeptidase-like regulatory domain-containing protein, partial [Gemmatimonadales bacterium]
MTLPDVRTALLRLVFPLVLVLLPNTLTAQGVTTSAVNGIVTDLDGVPVADANIVALHEPSGTRYSAVSRSGGAYNLPNLRVGGPYRVTATAIGFEPRAEPNLTLNLAENRRLDFRLSRQAVELQELEVIAREDEVLNGGRNGAATFI